MLTNGAVAVVSGRGIDNIDSFLQMDDLPVAGMHGAERRDSNGDVQRIGFNDERLLRMEHALEKVVSANPGMLLEIKGAALALHYRNAPDREPAARAATQKLVAEYADAYVLQPGEGISGSHSMPIGQVFFVPREEITLRDCSDQELEEIRQSADRFSREKAAVKLTSAYGMPYSPQYSRQSRAEKSKG